MHKRRVCHISTLTALGGVERLVSDLLLADSDNSAIKHYLMTSSSDPTLLAPLLAAGVTHFEPTRRRRFDPSALWQMARWLRKHQIEVVHCYNAFANVTGSLAARLAGIRTIYCGEHGTAWWVKPPLMQFDRLAQASATGTIANSHASKQMLQQRYKLRPEKIYVVQNGVRAAESANEEDLSAENDSIVIGTIGRLNTPKYLKRFIEAAADVVAIRPTTHFMIVGGGPLENQLRRQIEQANLTSFFTLTGWRSDARMLLTQFDIFVSTSVRETFGLVLVEAALAGKPVIAPAVDGVPEIVQHRQTGLLLTPSESVSVQQVTGASPLSPRVLIAGDLSEPKAVSAEALADAMLELIDNPTLRLQFGRAARQRAIQQFDFDRYRTDLTKLYLRGR